MYDRLTQADASDQASVGCQQAGVPLETYHLAVYLAALVGRPIATDSNLVV